MRAPQVPLLSLDTLWVQVAGTICNLRCTHCFISCAPDNHRHGMISLETVRDLLAQAVELGVREVYFTGGEPFMNRDFHAILEETLAVAPAHVLTNGLLLDPKRCRGLKQLSDRSEYSLDLRVSLDGWSPEDHDRIRGPGTFRRAVGGIRNLEKVGLPPVVTVTEAVEGVGRPAGRERFLNRLREFGLSKPRLKVLPLFRMGEEKSRSRAYQARERLHAGDPVEVEALPCSSCRMVTSQGVFVCPILIDQPGARMGSRLRDTLRPFELFHPACSTCHLTGVSCRT